MLNPKKGKDISKKTAKILDLDEELVEDVISFFWSELHRSLTDLEHPRIEIPNFGTFKIKPWMLEHTLDKYKRQLAKGAPTTFNRMQRYKGIEFRADKVKSMVKIFEKEADNKVQFKLKKKDAQSK